MIRFGSVCSGVEAASVAWHPLGWEAAWFAEIEPFPSAALAHHYPHVPNLGDMTTIARRVLSGEVEAPDLLCGGTPCQAFSVAGLRKSLDDARGNLSLTFCEIANAIDFVRAKRGEQPAIVFWENVPGVLNTKDNAFGCFLAGLAGEADPLKPPGGKWSNAGAVFGPQRAVAWRILDAQYFGLAQRRRRVFVVASARNGFDPATVLFEWDGVRRDTPPSRQAGQDSASGTLRSTDGGSDVDHARAGHLRAVTPTIDASFGRLQGCSGQDANHGHLVTAFGGNRTSGSIDITPALLAHPGSGYRGDFESDTFLVQETAHTLRGEGFDAGEDGTGRGTPLVPVCIHADAVGRTGEAVTPSPDAEGRIRLRNPGMGMIEDGTAYNLMASGQPHAVVAFDTTQVTSLDANSPPPAVFAPAVDFQSVDHGADASVDLSPTMRAHDPMAVMSSMQVRRLTPIECERLMGFPDSYTQIPWRNKPASECPDGPRYKALGNSWAVPVVRWIGARILNWMWEDIC